ncbi:hypothetical protein OAM00_05690 [Verrucomicrobia bacterium]|jgi:hypothetical protein|nr:hypothetical protein [bacterium]MDB4704871.1 hypothetical protein [Verrucomicrobiota bacterium]MDB4744479.1 hypothetical protein [Verrucomicrobiota bacterium]MDC0262581.1 hypothetical protein [bacterium]MDC0263767.1 hypothetical protein [Verrucomicrobiota bacterium]
MADDQKTPQGGAAPADSGNVQPKKETVRINLPPKPTAAPTVKIPAPSAIAGAKPGAAPAAAAGGVAGSTQKLPSAAPKAAPAAPPMGGKSPVRPSPAMAPRASAAAVAVSGTDKGLAIAATIVTLLVAVRLFFL